MALGVTAQPNVAVVPIRACAVVPTLPLHMVANHVVAQSSTPENALGPTVQVSKQQTYILCFLRKLRKAKRLKQEQPHYIINVSRICSTDF